MCRLGSCWRRAPAIRPLNMDDLSARRATRLFQECGVGVGDDGRFELPEREPPCMGFSCCCVCPACLAREKGDDKPKGTPKQPWQLAA